MALSYGRDKSNCEKRDPRLVNAAVNMLKNAKEDNSEVQKAAAKKLYGASSIY
jgi:transposase